MWHYVHMNGIPTPGKTTFSRTTPSSRAPLVIDGPPVAVNEGNPSVSSVHECTEVNVLLRAGLIGIALSLPIWAALLGGLWLVAR